MDSRPEKAKSLVYFVGAGPGAKDLITVRGRDIISSADVIIYAGSLVNPELLEYAKDDALIYNSAKMTLEEVIEGEFCAHTRCNIVLQTRNLNTEISCSSTKSEV